MNFTEEEAKIIGMIENNLIPYGYVQWDIFILYEDSSFIFKDIRFWECKWNSVLFIWLEYLSNAIARYCTSHNYLEHIDLYKYITSNNSIFNMWIRYANSTNQERMFSCFRWIYLLYKEWEIVYIWQSKNIFNRIWWHRDKDYDEIKFIPIQRKNLSSHEAFLIRKHKPKYNVMHNN